MTPSMRAGMGAVPYLGGVTFRVWAPFALAVSVAGEFNDWSADASPLGREDDGYWSVDLSGAVVDQQYKFVLGHRTGFGGATTRMRVM